MGCRLALARGLGKVNGMQVQPYVFFDGCCEEAIEFYRHNLGAEVTMLMRYKDNPEPGSSGPHESGEKIMHASLRIGESTVLVSDGECLGRPSFQGFSLSITLGSDPEARRIFKALAEDGQVRMPMGQTFFSPAFGMVTDRFGVLWMVYVTR